MNNPVYIDAKFIEANTVFNKLVKHLKDSFASNNIIVPVRQHYNFPNAVGENNSTLLLMPAWNPTKNAGVKMVTIIPENATLDLPSVQGSYIYLDSQTGTVKAIIEGKSLTAKRTAAASALAVSYLAQKDADSLLMIGTGTLSTNLIRAHAAVRPIKRVYVWGRNIEKAKGIADSLASEPFTIEAVTTIKEKISEVAIISVATLSKKPLIHGNDLKPGQHIDLVGAYRKDMRESDDEVMKRASIFLDSYEAGLTESGDINAPLQNGSITKSDIKGDLFDLTSEKSKGRRNASEITVFKSVGHALEDLTAASYYYNKFTHE